MCLKGAKVFISSRRSFCCCIAWQQWACCMEACLGVTCLTKHSGRALFWHFMQAYKNSSPIQTDLARQELFKMNSGCVQDRQRPLGILPWHPPRTEQACAVVYLNRNFCVLRVTCCIPYLKFGQHLFNSIMPQFCFQDEAVLSQSVVVCP